MVEGTGTMKRILAIQLARSTNRRFVSPYNDPQIIAGQGTIGLEILQDLPNIQTLLVRIPTKSAVDSERRRPFIPIEAGREFR